MVLDETTDIDPELQHRLSSWRTLSGVVEEPSSNGEPGRNEAEVRKRQRRATRMCLTMVTEHDVFFAELKDIVEKPGRDPHHQQRVEDEAAFALGVHEQFSAQNLHKGLQNELADFPKEVIQTVTVPAPQPPKSWFQRVLGI